MTYKISIQDDVLESLYKSRIRESDQLKTVLEVYDLQIHEKISKADNHKVKTMAKRSVYQKLRSTNFEAINGRIEVGAVVQNCRGQSSVGRGSGECWQLQAKGQCSKG